MDAPLAGVRIWLSGSVPGDASPVETARIRKFVEVLATRVFELGGHIAYGSHPSLLGPLHAAAGKFNSTTGKNGSTGGKAPLGLFVSRLFLAGSEPDRFSVNKWQALCGDGVEETPEAFRPPGTTEQQHRANSLMLMRQILVARCNVIVALGGKWRENSRTKAGVAEEIELARNSFLPLFLLGGKKGAVAGLRHEQPELFRNCANGLSIEDNESLAAEIDPATAAEKVITQLRLLPLRGLVTKNNRPFRILCLDGGGIRGAYTAAVLAYWEKTLQLHQPNKARIVDHFDLIAGTSTGGILAIGLGLGMSATEMVGFYEDKGESIFGKADGLGHWWHSFRHWFTSKFDQSLLRRELQDAYQKSDVASKHPAQTDWMDNSVCRLVIPSYNTTIDRPHLFRTPHGRFRYSDRGNDAVVVALGSAAAPTYFDPVTTRSTVANIEVVDGGVWANSPVTVAIGEAIGELNISLDRIHVLSIGTTHTDQLTGQPMLLDSGVFTRMSDALGWLIFRPFRFVIGRFLKADWKPTAVRGRIGWVANIAGLLMKTQAQTSDMVASRLLGDRYIRVDSSTVHGELDDVQHINDFTSLGEDAAKDPSTSARVQALFLNGVAAARW